MPVSIRVLALRSRPVVRPCGWAFSCLMTARISWPPRPGRIRCRPPRITWAVIFQVVGMPVQDVSTADVLAFITAQRVECPPGLAGSYGSGRGRVDADGCSPVLDHLGLFAYLHVHGDVATRSVPRGLVLPAASGSDHGKGCRSCAAPARCRGSWARPRSTLVARDVDGGGHTLTPLRAGRAPGCPRRCTGQRYRLIHGPKVRGARSREGGPRLADVPGVPAPIRSPCPCRT